MFLASKADIAVYGGGAGGGKSYALLLEPLRHYHNPNFPFVIFRREAVQLTIPGGLWDESHEVYSQLGALPREKPTLDWIFPNKKLPRGAPGLRVKFAHLNQESDKYAWQGAQVPGQGYDEFTHFTETQFFYMLSRNRSTSGVRGYVRATCNPDPDSWVAEFIAWWIDQDPQSPGYGYPIAERSGILRWFVRDGNTIVWGNSREELLVRFAGRDLPPKSVTFIPATVYDNKILLEKDPGYLANLNALCLVEREQLLRGNWKIRPSSGLFFKRHYFKIIEASPAFEIIARVRYWDRAATAPHEANKDPDWTVGVKMALDNNGGFIVEDVRRDRLSPGGVEDMIKNTATEDGPNVPIWSQEDPGSAGKSEALNFCKMLPKYDVHTERLTGDKITRAKPASAQAEAGNMRLVRGPWNKDYLDELEGFPKGHDDQVDGTSGAFNVLVRNHGGGPRVTQT